MVEPYSKLSLKNEILLEADKFSPSLHLSLLPNNNVYNVILQRSMLIAFGRGKRYVKCTECGELFWVLAESKMDYLFGKILRCPNCGSVKTRLTSIFIKTDHEIWDQITKE